ncbi:MAG: type IX secretion system sortase PorU [Calditrichaeota bacterium]|nr:type IX secretion system sortase PorU [Calditrichota bacterium]
MPGLITKSIQLVLLISFCVFAGTQNDLKTLSKTANEVVFEWTMQNFKMYDAVKGEKENLKRLSFENAVYPSELNLFDLPSRMLRFGIPANGDIAVQIISSDSRQMRNTYLWQIDETISDANKVNGSSNSLFSISEKSRFRDIMTRHLVLNPVRYDPAARVLTVYNKITFRVLYDLKNTTSVVYKSRGKLDDVYSDILVNFDQAQNWQIPKTRSLKKIAAPGTGTFYGFPVNEDGIYKITASAVLNAVNADAININSLQLFNNGGHKLSFATDETLYNPPYTQETAIHVVDQNNNSLFDGNDYFLFYGKSINSWFLSSDGKSIEHQMHPYDTENRYYLSVNGSAGKRMISEDLTQLVSPEEQNYFIDRFHFEEDKYNLLNSGPDWYGYRFFGTSGSNSVDFNVQAANISTVQPKLEIQFKGESGVHYLDNDNYRYTFNLFLNNTSVGIPIVFSKASRISKSFDLNSTSLNNGSNNFRIQYTSNLETSSAHLDYFSLTFPRLLTSTNNYLNFYLESQTRDKRYAISGLNNASNLYLFDVTNPADPKILSNNLSVAAGTTRFDIPSNSGPKNFILTDLASSQIKTITKLSPYRPENNLLDPSKQADFIIITSKSLTSYGRQVAELRDHLKTEVVSVDDIFFYFNNGVQDPTAIRNFIRYAYYNWQSPSPSYVLLFGDGNYDYRNIQISDSSVVPTFQIYGVKEVDGIGGSESRESDLFFTQLETSDNSEVQTSISPSIAIGRIPVENSLDAERMVEKLRIYKENPVKDGWQTTLTLVADDNITSNNTDEGWWHQPQAEGIARRSELSKFNINKIYISGYEGIPGGRGVLKPKATQELIDRINRGTLIVNYFGHGSPTTWAHETLFNFERDYNKINNEAKFPLIIAATCDFGIFDNPNDVSFSEALVWKENSGAIAVVAATRLVYSTENERFTNSFYRNLFPDGAPSEPLGKALIKAVKSTSNVNDQKYHLLGDPSMTLADARENISITSVTPDTLKALSQVNVKAQILENSTFADNFQGGAVIIMNDAVFEDVNTGGTSSNNYTLPGPLVFKGEVSVSDGLIDGNFIIPKSIRYQDEKSGRITLYAWDDQNKVTAMAYKNDLLLVGSSSISQENDGPEIDIYFEGQENFSSGDIISSNPVLIAELTDQSGINMTGQLGHKIELRINENEIIDISESFSYERDSFTKGFIHYPLTNLEPGENQLSLQAYDNLNNRTEQTILFKISESSGLVLTDVVNYPNPFRRNTRFTFQTNADGAEVTVKIYTISGRKIEQLEGYFSKAGYNEIDWNGLDRDGNTLANGVYLYKIILKDSGKTMEKIEKLVVID